MPTVECPQCGTWLDVADQAADPIQCPQCGGRFPPFDPDDTRELSNPDATREMPQ